MSLVKFLSNQLLYCHGIESGHVWPDQKSHISQILPVTASSVSKDASITINVTFKVPLSKTDKYLAGHPVHVLFWTSKSHRFNFFFVFRIYYSLLSRCTSFSDLQYGMMCNVHEILRSYHQCKHSRWKQNWKRSFLVALCKYSSSFRPKSSTEDPIEEMEGTCNFSASVWLPSFPPVLTS